MSEDAARETIEARINTWRSANPTVKVEMENQRFKEPTGADAKWVSVKVIENEAKRVNLGAPQQFSGCGVINVQIMVAPDTGTVIPRQIRQSLFEVLCDRTFQMPNGGRLTTSRTEKRTRGLVNGWYCMSLMMEYHYYFMVSG